MCDDKKKGQKESRKREREGVDKIAQQSTECDKEKGMEFRTAVDLLVSDATQTHTQTENTTHRKKESRAVWNRENVIKHSL
jgi:hypothetical protein